MNEHGPILVPLDGSELAEAALSIAAEVAGAKRTHLALMSVWEEPGSGTPAAVSMEMEERAQDHFQTYLNGIRERLKQPEIRIIVRCGDPCESILQAVEEIDARMIVAASHGRSGLGRWLYGSTTSRLLHESRVPVLVVGPKSLEASAPRAALRHIMVPLDGSPLSEIALDAGADLAAAFGAKLSLVRTVKWAFETYPYAGAMTYVQSLDSDLEKDAQDYIRKCEASVKANVDVSGFIVRGAVADSLLTFEEQNQVDLVVMTTHARGGLARAVLGSTAGRLLQGRAPVLLLRPERDGGEETEGAGSSRGAAAGR
ncbi:MAG: universal stress protein [Chloroflexota bacterium]|nr:universal stress protein [Chloroflexota bacterium]